MNLEQTAASFIEQSKKGELHAGLEREERILERFGTVAFVGLGVVLLVGIVAMLYAVFVNMILNGSRPAFGVVLIAFLITAAMSLAYVGFREHLNEKRQKLRNAPAPDALPAQPTGKLLTESTIVPVRSVTEDTTALLGVKRGTKDVN